MSLKRMDDEKKDQQFSYRLFLGTCAAITLGGMLYGVRRQLKKENFVFSIKEHSSSVMLAFKALFYGTALCVGACGTSAAVVCKVYDIETPQDFADFMRVKVGPLWKKTPEFEKDELAIKDMSEKEEMDYWSKHIDNIDAEDNISTEDDESVSTVGHMAAKSNSASREQDLVDGRTSGEESKKTQP